MGFPKVRSYGQYASENYGAHSLVFTDSKNRDFYFSYTTLVAFHAKGQLVIRKNDWNNTTGKHLNWIDRDKSKRVDSENFKIQYNKLVGKGEIPEL